MENKKSSINYTGLIIFGGLLLGLFLLLRKNAAPISGNTSFKWLPPLSPEKEQLMTLGGSRYLNAEDWDISYNEEGLPSHIRVTRDAVQA